METIKDKEAQWFTDFLDGDANTLDNIYDEIGNICIPMKDTVAEVLYSKDIDTRLHVAYNSNPHIGEVPGITNITNTATDTTTTTTTTTATTTTTITNYNLCISIIYKELYSQVYRVFSRGSFKLGGRFYGAEYQQLPGSVRKNILINGEPTQEVDFKHIHPSFIWAENGMQLDKDIYSLIPGNDLLRKASKILFNIGINAPNKNTAFRAFHYWLTKNNQQGVRREIKRFFKDIGNLWEAILNKYPLIEHYLAADYGISAQFIDSEIAQDILSHFTAMNIPILCIHDSFIVQKRHAEELDSVMKTIFYQHIGFETKTTWD